MVAIACCAGGADVGSASDDVSGLSGGGDCDRAIFCVGIVDWELSKASENYGRAVSTGNNNKLRCTIDRNERLVQKVQTESSISRSRADCS